MKLEASVAPARRRRYRQAKCRSGLNSHSLFYVAGQAQTRRQAAFVGAIRRAQQVGAGDRFLVVHVVAGGTLHLAVVEGGGHRLALGPSGRGGIGEVLAVAGLAGREGDGDRVGAAQVEVGAVRNQGTTVRPCSMRMV